MPVMQMLDIDTLKKISDDGMKLFKLSLQIQNTNNVEIEEINEFAVLPNSIGEICNRTGADLIIMGITEASKFEEVLIGSTSISVVKNTKVPVIIIPPNAKCHKIERMISAFGGNDDYRYFSVLYYAYGCAANLILLQICLLR